MIDWSSNGLIVQPAIQNPKRVHLQRYDAANSQFWDAGMGTFCWRRGQFSLSVAQFFGDFYICRLFQGDLDALHPSQGWELEAARRLRWICRRGNLSPPSERLWQRESRLADERRGSRWAGWGLSAKTAGVRPPLPPQELPRLNGHTQREWEGSNRRGEAREQRGREYGRGLGRRCYL